MIGNEFEKGKRVLYKIYDVHQDSYELILTVGSSEFANDFAKGRQKKLNSIVKVVKVLSND